MTTTQSDTAGPLVSVIVPVYNAARYLRQCAASVLAQSYTRWQLILVDDGSTDSSGAIADELALADPRVTALHTPNGGPSSARNAGLDAATGDFLTFIDSDDSVDPRYIEWLLADITGSGADISCATFTPFADGSEPPAPLTRREAPRTVGATSALLSMLYQERVPDCSVSYKMFRRSLFDSERFVHGILYEDLDIAWRLMLRARTVTMSETPLYHYRTTPGSRINAFTPRRLDVLTVAERMQTALAGVSPALEAAARSRRLSAAFNMYGLMASESRRFAAERRQVWSLIRRLRGAALRDPRVRRKNRLAIIATYLGGAPLLTLLSRFIYRR